MTRLSKIATHRDELILEERQRTASERIEQEDDEAAEEREPRPKKSGIGVRKPESDQSVGLIQFLASDA